MKREYAHEPPIVSVTQLNPEQCEVLLHENINAETRTTTGANGEEQTTVYTAQEYTLIIPWREGIEDSIKANISAWTEMARKQELEELLPKSWTSWTTPAARQSSRAAGSSWRTAPPSTLP